LLHRAERLNMIDRTRRGLLDGRLSHYIKSISGRGGRALSPFHWTVGRDDGILAATSLLGIGSRIHLVLSKDTPMSRLRLLINARTHRNLNVVLLLLALNVLASSSLLADSLVVSANAVADCGSMTVVTGSAHIICTTFTVPGLSPISDGEGDLSLGIFGRCRTW